MTARMACTFLVLAACCLACSEDDPVAVTGKAPASQKSIVAQYVYGSPRSKSWLYELEDDGAGGMYFLASDNNKAVVGQMSTEGVIDWKSALDGTTPDILRIPAASGVLEDALLVVGENVKGSFTYSGSAIVRLVSRHGDVLKELTLGGIDDGRRLNGVALTTSTEPYECIAVGGVAVADTVSPYIVRLSLSEADTIRVTGETQLASEPNTAFFRVLTLTGQSPPEHVVVADRFHKRSSIETRALWKLTDTLDVAWKTDVTPSGATDPGVLDLVLHDGNVLACGSAGVEKDGGRWSAGLLASVSVDGQRNWARGIARSEKGDYFTRFFSSAGSWYVVGEFSGFVHGPTDGRYGLAGIFQVDMSSGAVLEAWTFGSADYASFFSGGIAVGTRVFCGGATNFKVSDSYHQGWLVEVDLGAPDPSGPPVLPSFPDAVSGWRHPLVPGR